MNTPVLHAYNTIRQQEKDDDEYNIIRQQEEDEEAYITIRQQEEDEEAYITIRQQEEADIAYNTIRQQEESDIAYYTIQQQEEDDDGDSCDEDSQRAFWENVIDSTSNVPGILVEGIPPATVDIDVTSSIQGEDIYNNIFERLPQDDQTTETEPASAVVTKLYPHQKQALCWMIGKENSDTPPPFWEKRFGYFYNTITKETRQHVDSIRGGILADDMGLGKTLEMIALIATNFVDGRPLVCPLPGCDKISSEQTKQKKDKNKDGGQKKTASKKTGSIQTTFVVSKTNEAVLNLTPKRVTSRSFGSQRTSTDSDNSERPAKRTSAEEKERAVNVEDVHSVAKYAKLSQQDSMNLMDAEPYNIPSDSLIYISDCESVITILDSDDEEESRNTVSSYSSRKEENDFLLETIAPSWQKKDEAEDVAETSTTSSQIEDVNLEEAFLGYDLLTGRYEVNGPRGTLIICPTSVLSNWQSQFEQHIDKKAGIKLHVHYGKSRSDDVRFMMEQDVVFTTYHTVIGDNKKSGKGPLYNTEWLRIVLDEGHTIRNPNTITAKLIFELKAQRRWVLSGTPIQNSMADLYSIINFLRVEPLTDKRCWNKTIAFPMLCKQDYAFQRIFHLMRNLSLRRTKTQKVSGKPVLELPARNVVLKKLILNPEQRKAYDLLEKEGKLLISKYIQNNTVQQNLYQILIVKLRLRQFCCHPKLVLKAAVAGQAQNKSEPSLNNNIYNKPAEEGSPALIDNYPICQICLHPPKNAVISSHGWVYCWTCIQVNTAQLQTEAMAPTELSAKEIKLLGDQMKSAIEQDEECIICAASLQDGIITPKGHFYCGTCFTNAPDITKAYETISAERRKNLITELLLWLDFDEEYKECPICYMKSMEIGHKMAVITYCGHQFCSKCIEKLCSKQPQPPCPICRQTLDMNHLIRVPKRLTEGSDSIDGWEYGAKLEALMTALGDLRQTDPSIKSVVVSQFTSLLDLVEKALREENFVSARLDGKMSQNKRKQAMEMFAETNTGSPTVFLLSLKAGGVGINLTAASRVFLMEPAWNPAAEEQCFDRCHRLGQTRDVEITKFIIDNSVEENMLKLQDKKRKLMSGAFRKKLSKEERRINYINELLDLFPDLDQYAHDNS